MRNARTPAPEWKKQTEETAHHPGNRILSSGRSGGASGAHYGPLIYRESRGRPIAFLWAVARLELTVASLFAVVPDSTILMQECCPTQLHKPLTDFLAPRGWTSKDQMGAGIFYEKGSTRLLAVSRMFSRHFVVYQLDQMP